VHALVFKLQVLQLSLEPVLRLLGAGDLLVQSFDRLLGFGQADRQLLLAALQLVDPAEAFSFEFGPPELDLGLGLGEGLESVGLLLRLLLNALSEIFELKKC
jgi:hypothetical protein